MSNEPEELDLDKWFHQIYLCSHPHRHKANVVIYTAHYYNEILHQCNSDVLEQITPVLHTVYMLIMYMILT